MEEDLQSVKKWLPRHLNQSGVKFETLKTVIMPWHTLRKDHWVAICIHLQERKISVFDHLQVGESHYKYCYALLDTYMRGTDSTLVLVLYMALSLDVHGHTSCNMQTVQNLSCIPSGNHIHRYLVGVEREYVPNSDPKSFTFEYVNIEAPYKQRNNFDCGVYAMTALRLGYAIILLHYSISHTMLSCTKSLLLIFYVHYAIL